MDYALRNAWTKAASTTAAGELALEEYLTLEADLVRHSGISRDEWVEMFALLLRRTLDEDPTLAQRFRSNQDREQLLFEIEKRLARIRSEQIELGLIA